MNDTIDVRFGSLFPWPFRFVAALVIVAGLALVVERSFLSVALILIGGFILSGYEGTEINKAEKSYVDYKSFFFLKSGKRENYISVEKIFVSTSKVKRQLYTAHTNHSSIFENVEYNGYLKFSNGEKIQLLRKRKKTELLKELERVSLFLNVPIEDNTNV
ncbi:MAG TPA: hypothetical protein VFZ52_23345 [Chryseolinea sp.]